MRCVTVCAQRFLKHEIEVDLSLLRNDRVPLHLYPHAYDAAEFEYALLYPNALHDHDRRGLGSVCRSCLSCLRKGKMPPDAVANFQYYTCDCLPSSVVDASLFDLMLVCKARATRISYMFNHNPSVSGDARQGYIKGNVAILPQDTYQLRSVIPPGADEIREAMCALFISSGVTATRQNVEKLRPVLVNKGIVRILANFLVEHNPWYSGVVLLLNDPLIFYLVC